MSKIVGDLDFDSNELDYGVRANVKVNQLKSQALMEAYMTLPK